MKRNFRNSLLGACLALCSLGVSAQGLQGVVVENFHVTNQADADYYNGLGNGSGTMTPGLTTYRVYIDMAPGYKLNTVFGSAGNVMDVTSTAVFWNDDGFGTQFPPQTSRHDDGSAFDSWITIGRASRSGGAAGCTSNLETLGVPRAADPDATTTHCTTLWSGFGVADKDGSVNGASADPTLVGISAATLAPFSDVDGGSVFTTTGSWALLPPLDGPEAAGENRVLIVQFTTAGTFSFHINISLQSPAQQVEFYTHSTSESGSTVSPYLTYPLVLPPDCEGTPGGPAQPGTACNDNNPNTGNDTWSANCVCAGQVIDCEGTPGGAALPGTACNDNNPNTGNDTWSANCVCAGQASTAEGTPGGAALPGTACNDNNPNTGNDTWSANCVCR
ncbi:MAG: hypothetical protein IPL52_18100 [Flavobacteriales bacterium]|nr:hypothetical protein [Flavobacteriales bacterium]